MLITDYREKPRYGATEAARYIGGGMKPATLRTWVSGRSYVAGGRERESLPLIQLPDPEARPVLLSFTNVVEAHVLNALRRVHGVQMHSVRAAIETAADELGVERLLIRRDLRTNGKGIFIRHLGELIDLSQRSQIVIEDVIVESLQAVAYGPDEIASRLFPRIPAHLGRRVVAIDPLYASGRPFIPRRRVSVEVLVERLSEGEKLRDVARDYDLRVKEVRAALHYADAA